MSVFESVKNLASFRNCRDETVPRKIIGKILEAGRQAPSPGNVQSLEFIVVEDEQKKEMLSEKISDRRVEKAPTAILILGDIDRMARRAGRELCHEYCNAEAAVAAQNMRLVAQEEGVSSCWIGGFDSKAVSGMFKVPEGKEVLGIVILGYSDSEVQKSSKFGLNSVCFYDEYDNQVGSAFDGLEWEGIDEETEIYGKKTRGIIDKLRRAFRKFL